MRFTSDYDVTYPIAKETLANIKREITKSIHTNAVQSYIDEKGLHIHLGDVLFNYNSHQLTQQSLKLLDKMAAILNGYPTYEILIEGHTDDIGSQSYNEKLSLLRAENVANYLKQKANLLHDKLYVKGHGKSRPLVKNLSKENRKKNRRVEITLKQSGH